MGKKKRKAKFKTKYIRYGTELVLAIAALITAIKH